MTQGGELLSSTGSAQFNRHILSANIKGSGVLEDNANGYIFTVPSGYFFTANLMLVGVDTVTNDTYSLDESIRIKNIGGTLTSRVFRSDNIGEGTLLTSTVKITYGSGGAGALVGSKRFTITISSTSPNAVHWVGTLSSTQTTVP